MKSLQDWVYEVEAGSVRVWMVRLALLTMVVGLAGWIGLREFNGLRTMDAMDLAQQGRQLALGKGFTTRLIRPLALWQLRSKHGNQAPALADFPETLTPPLAPLVWAGAYRLGMIAKLIDFEVPQEKVKNFRVYSPDYVSLGMNLALIVLTAFMVFLWAARQFDLGAGVLATVFFLGSSALWDFAIQGGSECLVVFLYAFAGWMFCRGLVASDQDESEEVIPWGGVATFFSGFLLGLAPLVQFIQIWPVLAFGILSLFVLRTHRWLLLFGLFLPLVFFLAWLGKMWATTGNPFGLNWAYFLADSAYYPGSLVWRTFSFDLEKTDVWRRVLGSVVKGLSMILQKGPELCGSSLVGALALVGLLHNFRKRSAAAGRTVWGLVALSLCLVLAFVIRGGDGAGTKILIALLPMVCVYGAAFLWIMIDRWKFQVELLGKLLACVVALFVCWPTLVRLALPEPPPFSYPPTYPPIFIFMRSWFETNEVQASDLPWAEAWYANAPSIWLPATREDFLKIHDRINPVFSILFTPVSSDVKMYSEMLNDNSEWKAWADLIRRQKPPDLPQAFATSLPPNNDYLLLSIQKRWN